MVTITNNVVSPNYLLAILNSKLIKFVWLNKFADKRKTFPKIKGTYLKEIPIKLKTKLQFIFIEKSNEIINNLKQEVNIDNLENQIDLMVYKLYELTYQESKIVDPELDIVLKQFGLSKEDYERMSVEELGNLIK